MRITKNRNKPHVILYRRNNGTDTWMHADDYFVRHDLSHFAIEKTAGYRNAFMGMLNNGMDIRDFENRQKRRQLAITAEAWYAENAANLFLIETTQGRFADFNQTAAEAFSGMRLPHPVPVFENALIDAIRTCLRQLLQQWSALPEDETMIVHFDL